MIVFFFDIFIIFFVMLKVKKTASAYALFVKEQFEVLKNEDLTPKEKMIICSHRWKARDIENRCDIMKKYIINIV